MLASPPAGLPAPPPAPLQQPLWRLTGECHWRHGRGSQVRHPGQRGTGGGGGGERAGHTWGWGGKRGGKTITDKRKKETVREEERDRRTRDRQRERERHQHCKCVNSRACRKERGDQGAGSRRTTHHTTEGAPPHRLGQGRQGLGEGSHLQLYPTGQRRVNDGGRAGCPGQEAPRQGERESRVSQSSSPLPPLPPSPPPPPRPTTDHHHRAARAAAHSREEES